MGSGRARVIFDASGLNALADDPESNAIVRCLGIGFSVRLTETNLSEIAATRRLERRTKLLGVCQPLVGDGECIRPYNWIIEEQTRAHARNPARFNWEDLVLRGRELEDELVRPVILGKDALAEEILADFEASDEEFEAIYRDARLVSIPFSRRMEQSAPTYRS